MSAASFMMSAVFISSRASPSSSNHSRVAPKIFAAACASAVRCRGVPLDAASPREQMTKCAERPPRVSSATTPPQPNSMSSGCAPNASNGAGSAGEFGIGFIGAVYGIAVDKFDFRRLFHAQIGPLARARDVVRAMHHGLHPAQARITRGADLLLCKGTGRDRQIRIATLVQRKLTIGHARTDNLALMGNIHKKLANLA